MARLVPSAGGAFFTLRAFTPGGHQIDIREDCVMTKAVSIALLVGGIVLLYFGGQSFHSFSNDVSRVFTGAPTNKTIYLLAGGAIATIAGLIGLTLRGRR
jgi:hypothetical protein